MPHRRRDVHHHAVPPTCADWLGAEARREAGGRERPAWSAEGALAVLDAHEIETVIVAIATPRVHVLPGQAAVDRADAAALSREVA